MCGIVGYWVRSGEAEPLTGTLRAATQALRHRGPDEQGVWFSDAGLGFGHARLSIIDLSPSGAQPLVANDAEIAIVFNGEVYNFAEIARELSAKGYTFKGHSDTEIVLASFREWGGACVERFVGMFAFAIWDGPRRRLSVCRDRVGVKPLYYSWDGCVFTFASELKALRVFPHWRPEINLDAVGEFLQYGYIGQPRTIYRRVAKLPPGCWVHLESDGSPRIEPYWSLHQVANKGPLVGDPETLKDELEALLVSASRYRMVSDVPVGLFLSGGIDSSLVAAILKHSGEDIETFTIGFRSAEHDESEAAAKIAAALGLRNNVEIVDEKDAESTLSFWADLYDEPFGDHSGIPTYLLAKMARKKVKVALSADGGDELFCGYSGYPINAARMTAHGRIPDWLRRLGSRGFDLPAASALADASTPLGASVARTLGNGLGLDRIHKLRNYFDAAPGLDSLRPFRTFWQAGEVSKLLGVSYRDPRRGSVIWPGAPLEQIAGLDFLEYLPDDVLAKLDRATMAVGLEGREPLLDHRVVEMAFRLPLTMRLGNLGNKHVLRDILYRHVPRELVDRPKHGFAVPIGDWMTHLIASGAVAESNEVLTAKMGLSRQVLDSALAAFADSGQGKNRLWLIYVLGRWAQRWL